MERCSPSSGTGLTALRPSMHATHAECGDWTICISLRAAYLFGLGWTRRPMKASVAKDDGGVGTDRRMQ